MVAKRKRVSRLEPKNPAHPKVSPSRSAAEGARRDSHKKVITFSCSLANGLLKPTGNNGLLKPTGNVGQQAKDNRRGFGCQCDIG
ncbi:hypothetical protein N8H63_002880 [Acinetobacter baumannii]|nr:hypothetical protein [Acinetobacter baumannii]